MAVTPCNETLEEATLDLATNTTATRVYDGRGAMLFTVATVLVYGMSIVAFIAGHLRRRHTSKEEESQISNYLKRSDDIRRQAVREDVLRLRSQLLAGSVIVNTPNERRKSRVYRTKQYPQDDLVPLRSTDRTSSTESLVLPACTIPPPNQEPKQDSLSEELANTSVDNMTPISEDIPVFPPDNEQTDSDDEESKQFMDLQGRGRPRNSLHQSLQHSLLNGDDPSPSPEGSPDLEQCRRYRERRRGGVLGVHLLPPPHFT